MDVYQVLKEEKEFYERRIEQNKLNVSLLPEGRLAIYANGSANGVDYYVWKSVVNQPDGSRVYKYIPKSNEPHAAALAYKAFLLKQIKDDESEVKVIERFLRSHNRELHGKLSYKCQEEYDRLLRLRKSSEFEEMQKWLRDNYVSGTNRLGKREIPTESGINVRSKSESFIADLLYRRGIPFLYEPVMVIDGKEYNPDFLIVDPVTRQVYIWEHFGLMGKEEYVLNTLEKLKHYFKDGWILGVNLIVTTETQNCPFSVKKAADALSMYM